MHAQIAFCQVTLEAVLKLIVAEYSGFVLLDFWQQISDTEMSDVTTPIYTYQGHIAPHLHTPCLIAHVYTDTPYSPNLSTFHT